MMDRPSLLHHIRDVGATQTMITFAEHVFANYLVTVIYEKGQALVNTLFHQETLSPLQCRPGSVYLQKICFNSR